MIIRGTALILSPDQRLAVAAAFSTNGLRAIDPLKGGRSPQIILARNRITVAREDETDFIPLPQRQRKRQRMPQPMMPNPNRERGFYLAEKP